MSRLRGKIARFLALLALIAGLAAPALSGFAVAEPMAPHAAMGCADQTHQKTPVKHLPGTFDCCVASVCAMNLALPATPAGLQPGSFAEGSSYDLRGWHQPAGIALRPIPHPPKTAA